MRFRAQTQEADKMHQTQVGSEYTSEQEQARDDLRNEIFSEMLRENGNGNHHVS